MPLDRSARESHFPAIEKRYGQPMTYWFATMKKIQEKKYPEQMAFLQENFGFSRAHANALIMYSKGSLSSKRFTTMTQFLTTVDPIQAKTIRAIFRTIKRKYPTLEIVIAWNKPMLKSGDRYVFGVATTRSYLLIAPWDARVIRQAKKELAGYHVNKKTIKVPSDWEIDEKLLFKLISLTLRAKSKN
ncbi:MAG: DUF4287 domain-containing protein [Actinobacteria bacterium]|nr:DUF4287 domain-containing protein [Actinomycetota bacterium]